LPAPEAEDVKIQQLDKRVAAALRFNGKPTLEVVEEKKKVLEQALRRDGLKLKGTFGLARYNDPGRTWPIFMVCLSENPPLLVTPYYFYYFHIILCQVVAQMIFVGSSPKERRPCIEFFLIFAASTGNVRKNE